MFRVLKRIYECGYGVEVFRDLWGLFGFYYIVLVLEGESEGIVV